MYAVERKVQKKKVNVQNKKNHKRVHSPCNIERGRGWKTEDQVLKFRIEFNKSPVEELRWYAPIPW